MTRPINWYYAIVTVHLFQLCSRKETDLDAGVGFSNEKQEHSFLSRTGMTRQNASFPVTVTHTLPRLSHRRGTTILYYTILYAFFWGATWDFLKSLNPRIGFESKQARERLGVWKTSCYWHYRSQWRKLTMMLEIAWKVCPALLSCRVCDRCSRHNLTQLTMRFHLSEWYRASDSSWWRALCYFISKATTTRTRKDWLIIEVEWPFKYWAPDTKVE